MQFLSLSWDEFAEEIHKLSQKIKAADFDVIIAMARGGLTVSHLLSDYLSLPLASFTISSYKDLEKQEVLEISYEVGGSLAGKRVLLVDDVSDSGRTFERGIIHLQKLGATSIKTAAVFVKPTTKHLPDYSLLQTDKWIIFPFDKRETVLSLMKDYKKKGFTIEQIKHNLRELKIPDYIISEFV